MVKVATEVRKELLLEFQLPGTEPSSSSSFGGRYQMESCGGESWRLRINQQNALATADAFAAVAKAIRETMAK